VFFLRRFRKIFSEIKMAFSGFSRLFSEKSVKMEIPYNLSRYFPFPMKNSLKKLYEKGYIRHTDYLLCPIYSTGDFQIGVTGSVEKGEEPHISVCRELGEEIGVVPKERPWIINEYLWRRQNKQLIKFYTYQMYIKDCVPVLEHQHQAILSKNVDRNDMKVGCYVYGDRKNVLAFLNSERIYVYRSMDGIIGVCAIKLKEILPLILENSPMKSPKKSPRRSPKKSPQI